MSNHWFVDIIRHTDGSVEKTIGPFPTERMAERAERGVNINLRHKDCYTVTRNAADI